MRKSMMTVLVLTSALTLAFLGNQATAAQQAQRQEQSKPTAKSENAQNAEVYRMNYKISELENGKTINSRSYSLMAKTGARASTRVGSRVPYGTGPMMRYLDVGMNIDCTIRKADGNLLVHTDIDMNTVADKEAAKPSSDLPLLRQLSLADDTVATLGGPAFVGSIDDVASNHRYVVEVTVTKAM